MKKANNDGIRWLILIGAQEVAEGCVRIKDMESGSETAIDALVIAQRPSVG